LGLNQLSHTPGAGTNGFVTIQDGNNADGGSFDYTISNGTLTATDYQLQGGTVSAILAGSAGVTTPGVNPPSVSTPGVRSQSVTAPSQANLPPAPNAQGSANAVKKIERDGYKNVQGMTRNPDGSWSGKALRGGAMVDVQVDARGNVVTK